MELTFTIENEGEKMRKITRKDELTFILELIENQEEKLPFPRNQIDKAKNILKKLIKNEEEREKRR